MPFLGLLLPSPHVPSRLHMRLREAWRAYTFKYPTQRAQGPDHRLSIRQRSMSEAWVYTGPFPKGLQKQQQQQQQQQQEASASRNDGETITLRIHACALNPVDIQLMNLKRSKSDAGKPWGIVNDFSATVVHAKGFTPGDQVFGMTMSPFTPLRTGALARQTVLDAGTTAIAHKPDEWTHEQACAIPLVWLTARECVEDVSRFMKSREANRLIVLGGSSAVGMYTIILAKRRGWTVLTTSSARRKAFLEQDLGIDQHVDYTSVNDIRPALEAFQPSAIIDCVGGTEAIGIRGNRRYISIVGDKTSRASMGGPYTYYDWRSPRYAIAQWARWAKGRCGLGESYDVVHLSLRADWLEEAKTTLRPAQIFIDSTFDFDEADQGFQRLDTGRAQGKVVVKMSS